MVSLWLKRENIFWLATISTDLSAVFMLFAVILYIKSGLQKAWGSVLFYIGTLVLAILGLLSYELALVLPLLLLISDVFITKKLSWKRLLFYIPFVIFDGLYFVMRFVSHAFTTGGDYSYSLPHLIPNVVGNIVGYFGLFLSGEWSLSWYTLLRNQTKIFALPIGVGIVVVIILLIVIFRKTNLRNICKIYSIPLFAIAFSIVSLLPFLPLGNITERYGYLSSVGFVLLVVWLGKTLAAYMPSKKSVYVAMGILSFVIVVGCFAFLHKEQSEWTKASKITYNTLGYFKIEYPTIPTGSTFIIVNRPIRYANAWIFPVGFPEGLWFVYGDETPQVIDVSSESDALALAKTLPKSHIFSFDRNYSLHKIR